MNRLSRKSLLLFVILSGTIGISVKIFMHHSKSDVETDSLKQLPPDVEMVLKGYSYSETVDDFQIMISGKQMVRRGKKLLGLRSNLVKTNFFHEIKGTLTTSKNNISFSAAEAEWDANPAHPLVLTTAVSVTKNYKSFNNIKSAKIFIRQGFIEINSDRTEICKFR